MKRNKIPEDNSQKLLHRNILISLWLLRWWSRSTTHCQKETNFFMNELPNYTNPKPLKARNPMWDDLEVTTAIIFTLCQNRKGVFDILEVGFTFPFLVGRNPITKSRMGDEGWIIIMYAIQYWTKYIDSAISPELNGKFECINNIGGWTWNAQLHTTFTYPDDSPATGFIQS